MEPPTPSTLTDISLSSPSITPKAGNGPSRATARQAEAAAAKEIYANLSNSLNNLSGNYNALHQQTMQVALLGAEIGSAQDVKDFCQQMREQELRQKEGIEEIQSIIDNILQKEGDEMRNQVNQEIADQIEQLVKEQVARCLKDHIPEDLQLELAENQREYEELQLALHNSESRRLNGTLRANRADDALHTIFMPSGDVSPNFPRDLKGLFNLDAPSVRDLMLDYGINGIADSRDANLNKFMQFCGVRYQLVVKPDNAKPSNANAAV